MDLDNATLHHVIMTDIIERGYAPTPEELVERFERPRADISRGGRCDISRETWNEKAPARQFLRCHGWRERLDPSQDVWKLFLCAQIGRRRLEAETT